MIILLGFIVLLACLIVGVRYGGLGLAAISGLGLAFFCICNWFGSRKTTY